MLRQGSGWIFNMEGFGAEGMIGLEQVPYGVTKYGVRYVIEEAMSRQDNQPTLETTNDV